MNKTLILLPILFLIYWGCEEEKVEPSTSYSIVFGKELNYGLDNFEIFRMDFSLPQDNFNDIEKEIIQLTDTEGAVSPEFPWYNSLRVSADGTEILFHSDNRYHIIDTDGNEIISTSYRLQYFDGDIIVYYDDDKLWEKNINTSDSIMVADYNAGTVIHYSNSENFITKSTNTLSWKPMFIYHHSSINDTIPFNYPGSQSVNTYYYENDTDSYILIHDMNVSGGYDFEIFIYNLNNALNMTDLDPIWSSNEEAHKFAFSPISNIIYYRDYSGNLISANISNPGEKTVVYLEDGVSAYRSAGIDIANDGVLVAFPGTTSNDERDMFITNGIESANLTSDHMKEIFPLFINP